MFSNSRAEALAEGTARGGVGIFYLEAAVLQRLDVIQFAAGGVRVVVDPKSALYVTGSELDYIEALQDGGFKVKNPNAATSCSCGESFSA